MSDCGVDAALPVAERLPLPFIDQGGTVTYQCSEAYSDCILVSMAPGGVVVFANPWAA